MADSREIFTYFRAAWYEYFPKFKVSILGGWPGSFAAQRVIRHKCSKPGYQQIFWGTAGLNTIFLLFFLKPLPFLTIQPITSSNGKSN